MLTNFHVAFCFVFPYSFQFLVSFITEWAPHWAPVCLWYSFLVQFFCTSSGAIRSDNSGNGGKSDASGGGEPSKDGKGTAGADSSSVGNGNGSSSSNGGGLVAFFRLVLPLAFVAEGVSGRSYLLDLSGAELLLLSFFLAALKMQCATSPIFMLSWAIQVFLIGITDSHPALQYGQVGAAWFGLGRIGWILSRRWTWALAPRRYLSDTPPHSAPRLTHPPTDPANPGAGLAQCVLAFEQLREVSRPSAEGPGASSGPGLPHAGKNRARNPRELSLRARTATSAGKNFGAIARLGRPLTGSSAYPASPSAHTPPPGGVPPQLGHICISCTCGIWLF